MHRLSKQTGRSAASLLWRLAPWAIVGLLAAGCLVDDNDKCGANQVIWGDDARCVCADGYVVGATGCEPKPEGAGSGPVGVNTPCTSDADCAAFPEATYCEMFVSHSCLVSNCTRSPNSCAAGWDCCSFANTPGFESLPTLCLATGLCPP